MTGGCNGMQVSYMLQHSVRLCTNTHHSCILGQSTSAKEHTCVITMNTRLNTCMLMVFSVILLNATFFVHSRFGHMGEMVRL